MLIRSIETRKMASREFIVVKDCRPKGCGVIRYSRGLRVVLDDENKHVKRWIRHGNLKPVEAEAKDVK